MPVSFFSKTTAANVWKSVTGVSAAGVRRGRGKGTSKIVAKDLNRGQIIGEGRRKLILPGLNARIQPSTKPLDVEDVGENREFKEKLQVVRKEMGTYRKYRENPLERGFSGRRAHGRNSGQPDDYNETSFDDFDSTVLMLRPLQIMTGIYGRTKRMQALVVTGNKNGLAGFAVCVGNDPRAVVRHARNQAAQSLVYAPRGDNHTVMHDFFSRYYHTTVFVERKPRGYGINAHRVIKAICEQFGITDLYATVDGPTRNQINLTKAFFLGLMNQRTYQDIANDKQLHLVDVREENYSYPQVLASPDGRVKTEADIKTTGENLDFTYYIYDGRIKQVASEKRPWFHGDKGWLRHLDKQDYIKNREHTKLLLAAKYGDKKVLDVFPYFRSTAKSFNSPQENQEQPEQEA